MSEKETFLATAETTTDGAIIIWDLADGKRVATLKPYAEAISSVGFSTDCSMLVTAGYDQQHRCQIIVWDMQLLLQEKTVVTYQSMQSGLAIAKQISEFPINRICFSPYEEFSLASCGRENIRFWRIRKGHLPGRPVLLNEYARGFLFSDLVYYNDSSTTPKGPRRPTLFVACNRGLLLRISCQNDQVICAYQLHSGAIRSLALHHGFAVTGGDDKRLRIWPMDFSDFLLESQHEGIIIVIAIHYDVSSQICIRD